MIIIIIFIVKKNKGVMLNYVFPIFIIEILFIMEWDEKWLHGLIPTKSWMGSCDGLGLFKLPPQWNLALKGDNF